MADNAQKIHFAQALNQFAERKVYAALQITGKALPASVVSVSGSIVTVKFELTSPFTLPNVTVPMASPEWIRYPTQAGDKGVVMSADASLGGMSGLGAGVATYSLQANLSSLVWFPVSNQSWSASEDPRKLVLYGPDGVVIRTLDKTSSLTQSAAGAAIKVPIGKTLAITTLPVAPPVGSGSLWNNSGVVNVVP